MGDTTIGWTEQTWNPTSGCDRISSGCDHCYALDMAKRLKAMGQPKYQTDGKPPTSGPGFGVATHPDALTVPLGWRKPTMCFVDSMADLMHAKVPVDFIARVWAIMAMTPQHTYQILTKRPERYAKVLDEGFRKDALRGGWSGGRFWAPSHGTTWPLENVWLGTSIESDAYVRRADALRLAPARTRFLSLEPLLGPLPSLDLTGIDWVIVGGESGPGARPMRLEWARDLVQRCQAKGVAVYVKQLGSRRAREFGATGKGEDWGYWPEDLRVREYPPARLTLDRAGGCR